MSTLWFCLVVAMGIAYVVLDGFDLGAGAIHLLVAQTDRERRLVLRSIGPVWDGNEVWLLAGGGTLYFAFPALYAAGFSGFYLPLMIVLWLLMLRGVAVEFRNHVASPVWAPLWDVVFAAASLLLAVFYGAALGNLVRGVPLTAEGWFFEPLWTDFRVGPGAGILDWYTIPVGLFAAAALVLHGSLWVSLKTEGALQERTRRMARRAWLAVAGGTIVVTLLTWMAQPQAGANLAAHPWGALFPAAAAGSLVGVRRALARERDRAAFLASAAYLAAMLASAAFSVYPYVLPAVTGPAYALTVDNAAASPHGLRVGFVWWTPGMLLACAYFAYTYRHFAGKVTLDGEGHY
ncbi:MAG TPA: cytochrome d ubiquinol oxidase subunit II [Candidatus Binatia bacterium]|nr:cytochrome d ubiquinol oxidase subunit II [Candidatus Binatia bacterium]